MRDKKQMKKSVWLKLPSVAILPKSARCWHLDQLEFVRSRNSQLVRISVFIVTHIVSLCLVEVRFPGRRRILQGRISLVFGFSVMKIYSKNLESESKVWCLRLSDVVIITCQTEKIEIRSLVNHFQEALVVLGCSRFAQLYSIF